MSAVEVGVPRARPLSGGLWTLFSWLRRDERSSSESLSSVGSDRTAASFAFLAPQQCARRAPLLVPPPPPPTDSYKKRVRDRDLRRHHDRDVTLLRKYGLHGFDAFSLPSARRAGGERERRAASELLQRRAHVPGKRRAPPPPDTLPRPRARKRPAPQPPLPPPTATEKPDEDIDPLLSDSDTLPMNSRRAPDDRPSERDVTVDCRSEKCSKKESKEVKPRQDRSFLKHIFDNRKRHSAIETSSVKLLPSISELDKQAHAIIEKYKLKELEQNTQQIRLDDETPGSSKQVEAWICTRCLRKYNATVITCLYCLPLENALLNNSCKSSKVSNHGTQTNCSPRTGHEDREKLKEILKEMKDSLPKNQAAGPSKIKNNSSSETESKRDSSKVVEAATLRIGSSVSTETKSASAGAPSSPNDNAKLDKQPRSSDNTKIETLATIENVLVTQPEVLVHTKDNIVIVEINKLSEKEELPEPKPQNSIVSKKFDKSNVTKTEIASKLLNADSTSISCNLKTNVNTPLKVSSLFNPIYIPKTTTSSIPVALSTKDNEEANKTQKVAAKPVTTTNIANELAIVSSSSPKPIISNQLPIDPLKLEPKKEKELKQQSENIVIVKKIVETQPVNKSPTSQSNTKEENVIDKLDQHSRRRNLINQLEQSIAKGDERAAAEAAVKLAQLRLSCSVLSFSSQIVAGVATSAETSSPKANDSTSKEASPSDTRTEKLTPMPASTILDSAKITTEIANKNHLNANNKTTAVKQEINNQIKLPAVASEPIPETVLNKTSQKKDAAVQNTPRCAPSTSRETVEKKISSEDVPILVWVEDKETTRGPVQMEVRRGARLGELRRRAERTLGLPARMQRWIVGRALCADDAAPLAALAGPDLSAPFYLCLVDSELKESPTNNDAVKSNEEAGNVYNDLVKLEQQAFVSNTDAFECGVCMEESLPGRGVVLRECVHSFCKECLSDVVRHSEEPIVGCPATGCGGVLQEREIKGLVTAEEYEKWLARGLAVAESGTRNAFHCRTRDCSGWALCEPGVRRFPCPVCKRTNCVPCQAIHEGETCEQHRVKLEATTANNATNRTDEGTRALLDSLIARGEALECPECSAIITKKWGCDWIKCSACKTEICWVTRGRRWGPAGRGDTSGGCRCGTDGKKCHPSCGYCH